MMFFPKKFVLFNLVFSMFAPVPASASCTMNACSGQIKQIVVDIGGAFVKLDTDLTPLNCSPDSKVFIRLLKAHPNYDSVFSGLLVSKTTGNSVTLRIDEKSNPCSLNYLVLGE